MKNFKHQKQVSEQTSQADQTNQEATDQISTRLKRAISRTDNQFALFFALVNFPEALKSISQKLINEIERPVIELTVKPSELENRTLDDWLNNALKEAPEDAIIFLYNFSALLPPEQKQLRKNLQQINWRRSALGKINRPLVIWLPHYAMNTLAEFAPDFYDWYSNIYDYSTDSQTLDNIKTQLQTEFSGDVDAADRMNQKEKSEWIQTLNSLLDENKKQNAYRANLLVKLGRLYDSLGENNKALGLYTEADNIYKKIGNKAGEGTTLNNISQIHKAQGDYQTALAFLERSLKIRQEIGDKAGEGTTLNNISQIHKAQGDSQTALAFLERSLKIWQEIGDNAGMCATLFNMGHIYAQNKQIEKALDAWLTVYQMAKQMNLAQALEALAGLAPKLGMAEGLDGWEKLLQARGEA